MRSPRRVVLLEKNKGKRRQREGIAGFLTKDRKTKDRDGECEEVNWGRPACRWSVSWLTLRQSKAFIHLQLKKTILLSVEPSEIPPSYCTFQKTGEGSRRGVPFGCKSDQPHIQFGFGPASVHGTWRGQGQGI